MRIEQSIALYAWQVITLILTKNKDFYYALGE